MAKELKDISLKVRITKSQKEAIDEYCEINETNVSDLIRECITEKLNKFQKEKMI